MRQLQAYSLACHPNADLATKNKCSKKAVFPGSFLQDMIDQNNDTRMIYAISNSPAHACLHIGVEEYSAMEGHVYLPKEYMDLYFIQDGDTVDVEAVFPPKATKIVVQPSSKSFADKVEDPRDILESGIIQQYPVLEVGDELNISIYRFRVCACEPSDLVSTHESEPELVVRESLEEELKEKKMAHHAEHLKNHYIQNRDWKPFQGQGRTLQGDVIDETIDNRDVRQWTESKQQMASVLRQPSIRRRNKKQSSVLSKGDYTSFSGQGFVLGSS